MPIEQTITLLITCGNPRCPGHDLDTSVRDGWTFVTVEIYGEPVMPQRAFCCWGCMATFTNAVSTGKAEWRLLTSEPTPTL